MNLNTEEKAAKLLLWQAEWDDKPESLQVESDRPTKWDNYMEDSPKYEHDF